LLNYDPHPHIKAAVAIWLLPSPWLPP
jgi:hypothetical protein